MQSISKCSRSRRRFNQSVLVFRHTRTRNMSIISDFVGNLTSRLGAKPGQLRDNDDDKLEAKRSAQRKGKGNVFDRDRPPLITWRQHERERIQLVPESGRTWRKTYRIREQIEGRTPVLHTSHRKLAQLAKQITGQPIDYAILQMQFSEKRISEQIRRLLAETKQRAAENEMNLEKLVVSQAWVGKGANAPKRIDIRGRGKMGVKIRARAHLTVQLSRGLDYKQILEKKSQKALDKVRIAEMVKEERRVRFPRQQWAW